MSSPIIHVEPQPVEQRLADLGLTVDVLRDAVLYGQLHRDSCTPNDAPSMRGFLAWGKTLRGLAEQLAPAGWSRSDEGNYPTVVNPSGDLAIAVSTGDGATGHADARAATKYPKGPATHAAVQVNAVQLQLIDVAPIASAETHASRLTRVTWLLLIARDGDEIRCELSLPGAIEDDGRVESGIERIILPVFTIEPDTPFEEDGAEEIDVQVQRRTRS